MKYLIFLTLAFFHYPSISQNNLRQLYMDGIAAYEAGDFALFKEKMTNADKIRPNHPNIVYQLARAYVLTGQDVLAIQTLNQYLHMDATHDWPQDTIFTSLSQTPAFSHLLEEKERLQKTIHPKNTYKLPILSSHPESIAYDTANKQFFIGGVRDGSIWTFSQGISPTIWASSPSKSWAVMGLAVDTKEETLWACTSALENYESTTDAVSGASSVLKYDLKTGDLISTYLIDGEHNFGDIIINKQGDVYVSDGKQNKIYWIDKQKDKLLEFIDLSEKVYNLQGITFTPDENGLFLSDYIDGIYFLDLINKSINKIKVTTEKVLIKGIDGLYFRKGCLIGLHNGTKPNRVVQYQLSEDYQQITGKKIRSQKGVLGEPTQGVWLDNQFHFIANSPWGDYHSDGSFSPKTQDVIIGVIEIDK